MPDVLRETAAKKIFRHTPADARINTPRQMLTNTRRFFPFLVVAFACAHVARAEIAFYRRPAPEQFNVQATLVAGADVPSDTTARVVLQWQDETNYLNLALTSTALRLVAIEAGQEKLLGESKDLGLKKSTESDLLIKRRTTSLTVLLDGRRVLDLQSLPESRPGQVGSESAGDALAIGRLRVQPLAEITVHDDFARTAEEQGIWQSAKGSWEIAAISRAKFSTNAFCYLGKGEHAMTLTGHWFWEDYRLSSAVRLHEGATSVGLVAYATDADNNTQFRWRSGRLELVTVRGGKEKVIASRDADLVLEQWYELSICVHRRKVLCALDRAVVFEQDLPDLEHGQAGLTAAGGSGVHFDDVRIDSVGAATVKPLAPRKAVVKESFAADKYMTNWTHAAESPTANMVDYTFHDAPTDWFAQVGNWGLQSRWACTPRWTWYSCSTDRSAVLWHKYQFGGDITMDVYVAFRMDSPFGPIYRRPGDINLTICGDGENLNSGYTFILGGWENRLSRLMRRDQVVAESATVRVAGSRDTFQRKALHYNWYHVQIARKGNTVSCSFNGEPAFAFEDPEPLTGKRVAFWTWDNQIMLARATIEASEITAGLVPTKPEWAQPAKPSKKETKLVYSAPGEVFEAPVEALAGVDLRKQRTLSFKYNGSPGMRFNLYFEALGQTHCVGFTGADKVQDDAPLVGTFAPPVLDGKEHTATIDLLHSISEAYADAKQLVVDRAFFGLMCDEPYPMCGYGGNTVGMTCQFKNIDLSGKAAPESVGTAGPIAQRELTPVPTRPEGALCFDTFESDMGQWHNLDGPEGAALARDRWHSATGRFCLRLDNPRLGGTFAAAVRSEPYSPQRYPIIAFDYRATHALRVDLLVGLDNGKRYTVKFTDYDYTWPAIGTIPGVVADNQWHHAEFNLLSFLKAAELGGRAVTSLAFASGGYPGNAEGLVYRIDNFSILPAVTPPHYEDIVPPTVEILSPKDGAKDCTGRIAAKILDDGAGVDAASIRLTVGDSAYRVGHPSLSYNPETGDLNWDSRLLRPPSVTLTNGKAIPCSLTALDVAGNAWDTVKWTWTIDYGQDKEPPPAPYVSYVPSNRLCRHTFEEPTADWGYWVSCQVTTVKEQSATGTGAIALTNLSRGSSNAWALGDITEIPLAKYPYVYLDYSLSGVPRGQPVRFGMLKLFFDGARDKYTYVTSHPHAEADSGWHAMVADLRRPSTPGAGDPFGIVLNDSTPDVARPGSTIYVDNVSVFSRVDPNPGFEWTPPADPSGIVGYSWVLDAAEETVPPAEVKTKDTHITVKNVEPGMWWFHLRALDGAGNWSDAGHRKIAVLAEGDTDLPVSKRSARKADAAAPPPEPAATPAAAE